jgi:hypothetical protein
LVHDEKRLKMASDQLYFKRAEEMAARFAAHPRRWRIRCGWPRCATCGWSTRHLPHSRCRRLHLALP